MRNLLSCRKLTDRSVKALALPLLKKTKTVGVSKHSPLQDENRQSKIFGTLGGE